MEKEKGQTVNPLQMQSFPICPYYAIRAFLFFDNFIIAGFSRFGKRFFRAHSKGWLDKAVWGGYNKISPQGTAIPRRPGVTGWLVPQKG